MAARRPRKSLKPKRPASVQSEGTRGKRHTFHLSLTPDEVERLREAAAAEVRSIGNYVAHLIAKDLARDLRKEGSSRRSQAPLAQPDDKRTTYSVRVVLTSPGASEALLPGQGRASEDVELRHEGGAGGAEVALMGDLPAIAAARCP
jgi:hypothetical protein